MVRYICYYQPLLTTSTWINPTCALLHHCFCVCRNEEGCRRDASRAETVAEDEPLVALCATPAALFVLYL